MLEKTNFPCWVKNFVKGSLSSVKVAPFFGGALSNWIDILRGVKQGCPLSPLLFVIAYDPLRHFLTSIPSIRPFAFADDLALTSPSPSIYPALSLISSFSLVSGLGINKDKSAVIAASPPSQFSSIDRQLRLSPWPDLTRKESGTHLGILFGRDVTLEDVWKGPLTKALAKLKANKTLIHSLPLSSRCLFINVFIVSNRKKAREPPLL